jgi:hypothetical protein
MFGPSAKPQSGRYLSFSEREEIALLRAAPLDLDQVRRLAKQPHDVERHEVRFVDDLIKAQRTGLVVIRPIDQLAHVGDNGSREVARCGDGEPAAFDRTPYQYECVARGGRLFNVVRGQIGSESDCSIAG